MAKLSPYDFRRVRRELVAEFGRDTVLALHRQVPLLDWGTLVVHWAVFFALVWLLGTLPALSLPWILCLLFQGFVIMAFGYVLHDFFVHRYVGGRRFAYWMGLLTGTVGYLLRTPYAVIHHDHHVYTGTDPDEAYKDDLDTRWKRLLFLTPVGYVLALRRALANEREARHPAPDGTFRLRKPERRKARFERRFLLWFWIALVVLGALRWRFVVFGYVLPLLVVLPVANVFRTIIEHAETNTANDYHCATYYRTGPVTRFLFFWDGGDCHLVHHVFPNIPFYKVGRAADLFRPFLLRQGVRERRSLLGLLWGYFVRVEPHRALWST